MRGTCKPLAVEGGLQLYPVQTMTLRFAQTANLCSMVYEGAVYTCGVAYNQRADAEKIKEMTAASHDHAERLVEKIKSL